MTHLGRDELLRWHREGPPAERERVFGHLSSCEACRRELAELARADVPAPSEERVREAVPIGLRALPATPPAHRPAFGRPAWVLSGLAAAVVLGAALLVLRAPSPPPSPGPSAAVRGDEIQPLAPVGDVSGPVAFRWSSPVRAARFRLAVRDRAGAVVYTAETTEERHEPVLGALRHGGPCTWQVEALDATGAVLARSPGQPFRLAAR